MECAHERVAQSVEHVTFNHGVVGSIPTALTSKIKGLGGIPEAAARQRQRSMRSVGRGPRMDVPTLVCRTKSGRRGRQRTATSDTLDLEGLVCMSVNCTVVTDRRHYWHRHFSNCRCGIHGVVVAAAALVYWT